MSKYEQAIQFCRETMAEGVGDIEAFSAIVDILENKSESEEELDVINDIILELARVRKATISTFANMQDSTRH